MLRHQQQSPPQSPHGESKAAAAAEPVQQQLQPEEEVAEMESQLAELDQMKQAMLTMLAKAQQQHGGGDAASAFGGDGRYSNAIAVHLRNGAYWRTTRRGRVD